MCNHSNRSLTHLEDSKKTVNGRFLSNFKMMFAYICLTFVILVFILFQLIVPKNVCISTIKLYDLVDLNKERYVY